ncbi:MAG TPA: DUF2089 domain-containing protein [Arachnia sp.]|nr:DUF2089 domain-containing protein [Arachnia sp.]HMT85546.1 DUF2089 domain-containing protein [Arachnia sp.]
MAGHSLYHPPADCPVCGDDLITTRKGCLHCGTQIAGEFASCEFCALSEPDLRLLRVFLSSRGNLREVGKFLEVSYPTARARLDAVLEKLGLFPQVAEEPEDNGPSAEDQILARVAAGEISPEVAQQLLAP